MSVPINYIALSCSAPYYPIDIFYGYFVGDDNIRNEIVVEKCIGANWGELRNTVSIDDSKFSIPNRLFLHWISFVEKCMYDIDVDLPQKEIEDRWLDSKSGGYKNIVIGLAPWGQLAVWLYGYKKSSLILWTRGRLHKWEDEHEEFYLYKCSLSNYCEKILSEHPDIKEYIDKNGMPSASLFDQYMRQYEYRILPIFGRWNADEKEWGEYEDNDAIPQLDYIEAIHTDGTRDRTRTDFLMQYHEAGRPQKLALCWQIGKGEFNAYVWFDERKSCEIFEQFNASHPGIKADLLFHADPEANHYEWLLYGQELEEPFVVAEDAYEMIIFRNRYEHYRTENYSQPKGAWIW